MRQSPHSNNPNPRPPRWASRFLEWYCAPNLLEEVEGDIYEIYKRRIHEIGLKKANRRFILDVLQFFNYSTIKGNRSFSLPTPFLGMYQNYFKTAIRNLLRYKGYSFINISGLAIGLASFILIFLFVSDELSYESGHEHAENTYRLTCDYFLPNDGGVENMAVIGTPLGEVIKNDFPQVEYTTRIREFDDQMVERKSDKSRFYETLHFVDSTIFDVFTLPLIRGEAQTALTNPNSVVLSETMAMKYFGSTDIIGEMLNFPDDSLLFQVTGVMEDIPSNTHLKMDILLSINKLTALGYYMESWWSFNTYTYIRFKPNTNIESFRSEVKDISRKYIKDQEDGSGYRQEYSIQPIKDIHLHSKLRGEMTTNNDIKTVYIFSIIGILILLVACINFMNLSTARSAGRAREVGLRKVVGAGRKQLVTQLLGESFIMTFISMVIAIGLTILVLPVINSLTNKTISTNLLFAPEMLGVLFGIMVLVGLLSGLYPAIFMSGFRPVDILKGSFTSTGKGNLLRKTLVVFQFATSIALIASTMIVYQQLQFMFNSDLGFSKEQVLILPTRTDRNIGQKFSVLADELEQLPEVSFAAMSSAVPGYSMNNNVVRKGWTEEAEWSDMRYLRIDEDFLDLYGVEVVAGRGYDQSFGTDETEGFLMNESAVKRLGWNTPEEAIGKKLRWQRRQGFVIGVIEDFHFMSVKNPIEPVLYIPSSNHRGFLSVKFKTDDYRGLLRTIETKYAEVLPGKTFEYKFLDEDFDRQYKNEEQFGQIFIYFTSLAVLIACMGLFGLAALAAIQRTKEISIRKVLGASVKDIIVLLSRNFMILVGIAFIVAVPLTWMAMNNWLEDFALRISMGPSSFILAGILAGFIAMGTISFHIFRTARANPAETLRSE